MASKPYLGCKISLISRSQNRYEGMLYTIDASNCTVVMAGGELFGCSVLEKAVSIFKKKMLLFGGVFFLFGFSFLVII